VRKIRYGTNLSCPKTSSTRQSPLPAETSPARQPPLTDILSWVSANARRMSPHGEGNWPKNYHARQPPLDNNPHAENLLTQKTALVNNLPNSQGRPTFRAGQLPCASTSCVPLLQGASTSRVRTPPPTSSPRYQPTRARLSPHGEGPPWPKISPTNNLPKRSDNNAHESFTPP